MSNGLPYSLIAPRLLVGECPQTPQDIQHLREQAGITVLLSLQTEDDRQLYRLDWEALREACRYEGVRIYELPIRDRDERALSEGLPAAVDLLDELLEAGEQVYLHCNIGNGRSPTVAAAWLHWRQGWQLERAVQHVSNCRRCQPNPHVIQAARPPGRPEAGL